MNAWTRPLRTVFVFLLFLEIIFRTGGWLTQQGQRLVNSFLSSQKDVYKILCIGESTTLEGGQDSYPSQLQGILNQNTCHRKFQVINQGVAGVHTGKILNYLEPWIHMYHPDMVIAMIGAKDPLEDSPQDMIPSWIKELKVVQLGQWTLEKIKEGFKESFLKEDKKEEASVDYDSSDDYDLFKALLAKQSENQKRVYSLLGLALIDRRYDVADTLFEQLLQQTANPVMRRCIMKKYGEFLILTEHFDKFVSVMNEIPFDSWGYDWVKGYCHGQGQMDHVKAVIEDMVINKKEDPHVYGYLASCYEEGGRQDLAESYLKKMGDKSSYYSSSTRRHYRAIKDILMAYHIQPVFVQYPLRPIRPLMSIFENDRDRERIIFVDNEAVFKKNVRISSYQDYFFDRALGDTGHATARGNELLASNIAGSILDKIGCRSSTLSK